MEDTKNETVDGDDEDKSDAGEAENQKQGRRKLLHRFTLNIHVMFVLHFMRKGIDDSHYKIGCMQAGIIINVERSTQYPFLPKQNADSNH